MKAIIAEIVMLTEQRMRLLERTDISTARKREWKSALDMELEGLYARKRLEMHHCQNGKKLKKGEQMGGPRFKH